MDEHSTSAIGRREAIKLGAKVAGVTAFAAPTVVGVFNAPSVGAQTGSQVCDSTTDCDAVQAIIASGTSWNLNCAKEPQLPDCDYGRYPGQTKNFTIADGQGTVTIGMAGTANECANHSYYLITAPEGYVCSAYFTVSPCGGGIAYSNPANPAGFPVPYCLTACIPQGDSNVFLYLNRVECCPVPV